MLLPSNLDSFPAREPVVAFGPDFRVNSKNLEHIGMTAKCFPPSYYTHSIIKCLLLGTNL